MSRKAIIRITPRIKDIKSNPVNGGSNKIFEFNEFERRQSLIRDLDAARQLLRQQFIDYPSFPGVLKIIVRDDAIAKSHRPDDFLGGMSILTYGLPNEIYVAAYDKDLYRLIDNCKARNTNRFIANISSILSIQCVVPNNKKVSIDNKELHNIIIKLFDYGNQEKTQEAEKALAHILNEIDVDYRQVFVGDKICSRIVKNITTKQIESIKNLPFVMSIRESNNISSSNSKTDSLARFIPMRDYVLRDNDIIAVVDSGISEKTIPSKYIYARESYIPTEYQDNSHGTFVASTILFGNEINNRQEERPVNFRLLDVTIIPRNNSGIIIGEYEFCECLKEMVEKYHDVVKIWNMSLGFSNILASDDAVSDVGIFCDELQKEYDVQFVISSGNYVGKPLRIWPNPVGSNNDRITAPSDSVMAISVGALAEKDNDISISKKDEPSPFSRRGPGGCGLFKPDLTDYGGNLLPDSSFKDVGILGIDLGGAIREDVGTSFSSPLIAYKLSKIYSSLVNKDILLAKALLIHDSLRNSPKIVECKEEQRKYYGFGQPSNDCENVLDCKDNEITIVLECNLLSGTMVDIQKFPFPESMIDGKKCKGEVFATLVAEPCLNKKYGYEYSRINFDLSIGTFSYDESGEKMDYRRQVNPLKPGCGEYRFESSLVEEDLKWNPIKTYHRKFKDGTDLKDGWRVNVQLHSRFQEPQGTHRCYVIITFIGKDDTVYDEMVKIIRDQAFEMNDIEITSEIRTTVSGE